MPAPSRSPIAPEPGGPTLLGLIASLARFTPPFEIDRGIVPPGGAPLVRPVGVLNFCFGYQDVPFRARAERRAGRPTLTLTGDLGSLPFSIENLRRRRRMLKVLAGAQDGTTLQWQVTPDNRVFVQGEIELGLPLTPLAIVAGAATLLVHCRPYIDLVVQVANEA